jgi:hypothetical protein
VTVSKQYSRDPLITRVLAISLLEFIAWLQRFRNLKHSSPQLVGNTKKQDADYATVGYLYAGFPTQRYKDADGDLYVSVLFYVQARGELIKIIIPKLYSCINPLHRRAFFEVTVRKTFEKKLCFFDYDHRDGEIRMVVDLPLEDASVTEKQIKRIIRKTRR